MTPRATIATHAGRIAATVALAVGSLAVFGTAAVAVQEAYEAQAPDAANTVTWTGLDGQDKSITTVVYADGFEQLEEQLSEIQQNQAIESQE